MAEILVLTCPVCDRSAGFRERTVDGEDGLKDAAWDHLAAHRLDESKRAIYAVMMVERRDQLVAEGEESLGSSAGTWRETDPNRLLA